MLTQRRKSDKVTIATEDHTSENREEGSSDPDWFNAQFVMSASEIPFIQAVTGSDGDEWRNAVYDEIKSLVRNDTWELVDRRNGTKVIGCCTVLRNEYKADRKLERKKVRVVAKGFAQRPGIDFHDTFAPVARLSSLRTLMAVAVDMQILQFDITIAYLNKIMDSTVYMDKPESLQEMLEKMIITEDTTLVEKANKMLSQLKEDDKVCKLKKSLYGLRQAGHQWHS